MTAEVAILNKQGVALAADSAVTIGDSKIFNTVNKLFALTKHEPVGVMVYSSADVMGVPVETVIKMFRASLGTGRFDQLQGYHENLNEFLRDDTSLFSADDRLRSLSLLANDAIEAILKQTFTEIYDVGYGWSQPTKTEALEMLSQIVDRLELTISNSEPISGVINQAKVRKAVETAVDHALSTAISEMQARLPMTRSIKKKLRQIVNEHYFRDFNFGNETGIVVAGFGKSDTFPHLRSCHFHCSALGLHKSIPKEPIDVSHDMTASIAPFAQADVMSTFVEGIDRSYAQYLKRYVNEFFTEKHKLLSATNPPNVALANEVLSIGQELAQEIPKEIRSLANDAFIGPLMGIVSTMPKEELALLAESFVNLTALKRKASQDAETVGGPTDVAVISKGDGFIWIKRKHYFDPKFNPTFTGRYMEK